MTASAATPAVWSAASRWLLAAYAIQSVGDRAWQFFFPLMLAQLFPGTIAPAAAMSLVRSGAAALLSSTAALRIAERRDVRRSFMGVLLLEVGSSPSIRARPFRSVPLDKSRLPARAKEGSGVARADR